jgi:predicted O-methyltransferase YrrM
MIFALMQDLRKVYKKRKTFAHIEDLRKRLREDRTVLTFKDWGSGGEEKSKSVRNITRFSAKNPTLCLILAEIVKHLKPAVGIELGTSMGLSLAYQITGFPEATFYSLEGSPEIAEKASHNLAELGIHAQIRTGRFADTLPQVLEELETLDYAFVDGHHQYEPTLSYFNQIMDRLTSNGCIVFDDIYWSEGMQKAWKTICADERVSLSVDLYHLGLVFVRKGVVMQHFKLRI